VEEVPRGGACGSRRNSVVPGRAGKTEGPWACVQFDTSGIVPTLLRESVAFARLSPDCAGNAIGGAITEASDVPTAFLTAAGFALGGAALGPGFLTRPRADLETCSRGRRTLEPSATRTWRVSRESQPRRARRYRTG
jgi:hypothetical protein